MVSLSGNANRGRPAVSAGGHREDLMTSVCSKCKLAKTPSEDIAKVLMDAAIALRNAHTLGLAGRQRHEVRRAHFIIDGLAKLFDAEARRTGQE